MNILLILAIVEGVFVILFAINLFVQHRNTKKIVKYAIEISKKNLDVEDMEVRGTIDTRALIYSINMIKKNLMAFVEAAKGNVITLTDSIDVLSNASKANAAGAESIADSVGTVADKTSEQLMLVGDNLAIIESNAKQLATIDEAMGNMRLKLDDSVRCCGIGDEALKTYAERMSVVSDNLSKSVTILKDFNEQILQVNSIGELIVNVSEELSLLSLNASIEAARAGEAGRGFAIVSQQMNAMSEQTKNNMDAITTILKEVTTSSRLVNESINQCNETFNDSKDIFDDLSNSFGSINNQSMDVSEAMNGISEKYKSIAKDSAVSKNKAEHVYAASEVISDNTRDIVAISEETNAESQQISENVEALENMLDTLRKLVKQFKTGAEPTAHNRDKRVKIAFFSKLDNFFWYSIRRGVMYAQRELANNNVDVIYYAYKDDIEEKQFPADVLKCIAEDVDSIIFPGFLALGYDELRQAIKNGIEVFTYNCDCDPSIKRISCYEPDQEEAGIMAADAVGKALPSGGRVAIIVGDLSASLNAIRRDSFLERLSSNYKKIKVIDTVEVTYNPDKTYTQIVELIEKNPDIDVIYSTTGMQIKLAEAIVDTGNAGKIRAVVFDQNAEIFEYIDKGVIAAAIDHDPFSQGHDPIIYMYNHIVDGMVLPSDRMKCKASVVDSDNIKSRIIG